MEDLPNLLQRDYGFRPQGKSAPMSATKGSSVKSNINANASAGGNGKSSGSNRGKSLYDDDGIFNANQNRNTQAGDFNFNAYDDVFGGPPKYTNPSVQQPHTSGSYDDIFQSFSAPIKPSSVPVFDTPVYDDDIFGGVRGVKGPSAVTYDDVFSGRSASPSPGPALFEDLLGGFAGGEPGFKASGEKDSAWSSTQGAEQNSAFDDLIPGFGSSEPVKPRPTAETKPQEQPSVLPTDSPQNPAEDPFVILEAESLSSNASSTIYHDPLEQFGMPSQSTSINERESSGNGTVGIDGFDGFPQAAMNKPRMDKTPLKACQNASPPRTNVNMESMDTRSGRKSFLNNSEKNHSVGKADFSVSSVNADVSVKSTLKGDQQFLHESSTSASDLNSQGAPPLTKSDKNAKFLGDIWLTVDEIELITQPTLAPPPARTPPPLVIKQGSSSKKSLDAKAENRPDIVANSNEFPTNQQSTQPWKSSQAIFESNKAYGISSIEELEDFALGVQRAHAQEREEIPSYEEEMESSSAAAASAAAMKEAMERAEAKLRLAREAREREREEREKEAKLNKLRESERQEREGRAAQEVREREEKEREARAAQDAHEREEKERQEQERERRRIEREREKEREREREREKDRIAVERATKEARERAATEARERAERAAVERATAEARERAAAEARERAERAAAEARERAAAEARERAAAERAAVERAAAEARERAERAAVERAAAEARERAAAEARERAAAERAAVDRAAAEVRLRAERAAVERANAEARERAAERASAERAAAAREKQRRNDNDLESFFGMGARPNSAPRQRPATSDTFFDAQSQNKGFSSEGLRRTSAGAPSGAPSGLRKASSAANITDDWTSIFTASSSEEFQEVEGEAAERRRARLERHQRTLERAAKALAEKNERDMQAQRDQAERHRFAETLDAEIKRWAAGKEGNLRALLSTLQYVLWPECGWQPVSLTDVITAASVKKVYRKATLCVHPDKVQQKGANIQQKYIAEKVFDLLKEAWNKFNSEELF